MRRAIDRDTESATMLTKTPCLISDACGRKILEAIRTRDTFLQEDWLILVTTDHGGIGTSHGGQTPEERSTWLASSKKIE